VTCPGYVARRYGDDFSQFGGSAPKVEYSGSGAEGKQTARGLEQHYYEQDVKTHGKAGVANVQNPVGPNNPRKAKHRKAANKYLGCK